MTEWMDTHGYTNRYIHQYSIYCASIAHDKSIFVGQFCTICQPKPFTQISEFHVY